MLAPSTRAAVRLCRALTGDVVALAPACGVAAFVAVSHIAAFVAALGVVVFATACAPAGVDDIAASRSSLTVCAGPSTVQGVDVSYYQGAVDWDAVFGAGNRFAIARVSDGLAHPDDRFDENWAGMQRAGLIRGAYQYFEPSVDARAQAALVVQHVGKLAPLDLPVALDAETSGGVTSAALAESYDVWLRDVEAGTGKRPLIYTASYFWNAANVGAPGSRDLWAASYERTCPDIPTGWDRWSFWQKGTGTVPGISTIADLDEFNGSLQDLVTYASTAGNGAKVGASDAGSPPPGKATHSPPDDRVRPAPVSSDSPPDRDVDAARGREGDPDASPSSTRAHAAPAGAMGAETDHVDADVRCGNAGVHGAESDRADANVHDGAANRGDAGVHGADAGGCGAETGRVDADVRCVEADVHDAAADRSDAGVVSSGCGVGGAPLFAEGAAVSQGRSGGSPSFACSVHLASRTAARVRDAGDASSAVVTWLVALAALARVRLRRRPLLPPGAPVPVAPRAERISCGSRRSSASAVDARPGWSGATAPATPRRWGWARPRVQGWTR